MDHRQGAGTDRRTGLRSRVTATGVVAVLGPGGHPALRGPGLRLLLAAVVTVLLLGACGGRDPAPFVAVLDGLSLPSTWQVAQTNVESQGGDNGCVELINPECPTVNRYYLVSGELSYVLEESRQALANEGFGSFEVLHPNCDSTLSGSKCFLNAAKEGMAVRVNLYAPGEDVDQLGLSRPDLATIRMTVSRN